MSASSSELRTQYLNQLEIERKVSPHTLSSYRRSLDRLATFASKGPRRAALEEVLEIDIRRFVASLHSEGLAPRSIAQMLSAWRTYFDWLQRNDKVGANPVVHVRAPRAPKRLPKALSVDLAVKLVSPGETPTTDEAALTWRDEAMFELLYSSGLRLSELVQLDILYSKTGDYQSLGWIDLTAAEVTVTGKGRKMRSVPIGAGALEALRRWIGVRPTFVREAQPALFLSQNGRRLSGRSVQLRLNAYAQQKQIPTGVHPHMLRHSFASHVLQSSGDLRAVQEMLGHTSIAATQVYTSLDFQHLAKIYDAAHPRARKSPKKK